MPITPPSNRSGETARTTRESDGARGTVDVRPVTNTFTCRACGTSSEQRTGRGRPWVVCRSCKNENKHRSYKRTRTSLTSKYRSQLKRTIASSKRRQRDIARGIYIEGVCVVCKRTHWMDAQAVAIGQRTCGNTTCSQRKRYQTTNYKNGIDHKNWVRRTAMRHGDRITRASVWERDNGTCHICETPAQRDDWHLDHVLPLSRGGSHTWDNVAVSHPHCNLAKGAQVAA